MSEILASQAAMLEGLGKQGANLSPEKLGAIFEKQLAAARNWLQQREDLQWCCFDYKELIENPAGTSTALNTFLGGMFDEQAMAAAVRPELYRQRHQ